MQPGNRFVNVFNSVAVYFDPTTGEDAAMKTVAFVGEQSLEQGYIPVALKPAKQWNWPSLTIGTDEEDFASFHENVINATRWYQPGGLKTTRQLQTVLCVPILLSEILAL